MFTLQRVTVPATLSLFITLGLIYFMFSLIRSDDPELVVREVLKFPPIVFVEKDEELITNPIEPIIEPEPQPEVDHYSPVDLLPITGPQWQEPKISEDIGAIGVSLNSQLVLALGYPPSYPQALVQRGVEGYAIVGFSVDETGAVFDAYIIESEPGSVFDRAALKSIKKFKYKPRNVDGKAVSTDGQSYIFRYQIDS